MLSGRHQNFSKPLLPRKLPVFCRYVRETYDRIKNGLDFYWTGTKILGNDIGYALTLVSKAAQVRICLATGTQDGDDFQIDKDQSPIDHVLALRWVVGSTAC